MCSFGKDSMALLHLIREVLPSNPMLCHSYPMSIIHHTYPWFAFKNAFANDVITKWGLEVYDPLPIDAGVKVKEDMLELVARYPFGDGAMDIPINTLPPMPRRDFACGLQWVLRPKQGPVKAGVKTVFMGHKSSDIDQFEGNVPLMHDTAMIGGINLVFPLRHWTDDDVWRYIDENHVPYDKRRYAGHMEVPDHWNNPDYINACTACIDPREKAATVYCPKLKGPIENVGQKVPVLNTRPAYVEAAA
jgi:hypothetical protein